MQNTPQKDNLGFDPFGGELFSGFAKAGEHTTAKRENMTIDSTSLRRHDTQMLDKRSIAAAKEPEHHEEQSEIFEEQIALEAESCCEETAEEVSLEVEAAELSELDVAEEEIPAAEQELPEAEEELHEEPNFIYAEESSAVEIAEELPEIPEEPAFIMVEEVSAEEELVEEPLFEAEETVAEEIFAEEIPAEEPYAEEQPELFEAEPELFEDVPEVILETEPEEDPEAEAEYSQDFEMTETAEDEVLAEEAVLFEEADSDLDSAEEPSAEETAELMVAELVEESELQDLEEEIPEETAIAVSAKTISIDSCLVKELAEQVSAQEAAAPKAEKAKKAPSKKKRGIFSPLFKKIGAAVALFSIVAGSLAYYGSLIKYTGGPDPESVAYLSMADYVRRTSAENQVVFLGESELRQVFLTGSSAERDLNLVVTDITGAQVTGAAFQFKVVDPEGGEAVYTDEDMDGQLSIEELEEGEYGVQMLEMDGFIVPGAIAVTVAGRIEYVKIENISEIIVEQDDIDIEKEDLMAGGGRQEEETAPVTPTNDDTVEYVESRTEEVKVEKTRTVTKFRGNIDSATGRLYYADGTLSNVVPVVDSNGYLTGEHSIYAQTYTITVNSTEGGSASAAASSSEAFKTVNITATPASGYTFSGWSASSSAAEFGDASAASTTLLVPAENVTITASFAPAQAEATKYTLTIAASEGGTASADGSTSVTAAAGAQISITAVPNSGYVFTGWTLSGGSLADAAGASTVFTMPEGNATVTAGFAVDTTGGAMGGDVNLFAKDQAGKYIYAITAETVEEKYTETVTKLYGWQTVDGKTYYYDKTGTKVTGTQKIQGVSYIFGTDGALAKSEAVLGIDVSTWQPDIDWAQAKASGVEYVIIRCGFRGYGSGKIVKDDCFDKHIRGAKAAGLKVGVYFFSQAINTTEGVEEASAVIEMIKGYSIDYPIVIDMEDAGSSSARTNGLTRSELTKIAIAFGETCRSSGYSAMIYANKYWLESKLDTSQLGNYYIWLAHYTGGTASSYKGRYEMWQYTSVGRVPGISGNVDMNYSYMG